MSGRLVILSVLALTSSCMVPSGTGPNPTAGQESSLEDFLAKHPDWRRLREKDCEPGALKLMRESFGAEFSPYHHQGDFNRDGRNDFAVILVNKATPMKINGLAESHRWHYKLKVVVFNGSSDGRYDAVFAEDEQAPLACFLKMSEERQSRLFFGVLETCAGFVIIPTKSGYRVEDLPDPG